MPGVRADPLGRREGRSVAPSGATSAHVSISAPGRRTLCDGACVKQVHDAPSGASATRARRPAGAAHRVGTPYALVSQFHILGMRSGTGQNVGLLGTASGRTGAGCHPLGAHRGIHERYDSILCFRSGLLCCFD